MEAAYLIPIAGPALDRMALRPEAKSYTLGRHEQCELRVPVDAETVSRLHAKFRFDGGVWRIADQRSRGGTSLNGLKLQPLREVALHPGDMIGVGPWLLAFTKTESPHGIVARDDSGQSIIRSVGPMPPNLDQTTVALLLGASQTIHEAATERELAQALVSLAGQAIGYTNAAVLRPVAADGRFQILASTPAQGGHVTFSRSLLRAASSGEVSQVVADGTHDVAQSIVELGISQAICVPLMIGPTAVCYWYLDRRGHLRGAPDAAGFCAAVGRMASLALANLKRIDLEHRQAQIESELQTAATAQRWMLPQRTTKFATVTCTGQSKAGRYLGGDFFDIIPLDEHRIALTIGDVAGKGIVASVLMTAAQGFLHAAARTEQNPGHAMRLLNQFVAARSGGQTFVTVWFGILDLRLRQLIYVDAGHGYALLDYGQNISALDEGASMPIGVAPDTNYTTAVAALPPTGRIVLVSDGFVEQPSANATATGIRNQFGLDGVRHVLHRSHGDPLDDLFAALRAHAGSGEFADDATALIATF